MKTALFQWIFFETQELTGNFQQKKTGYFANNARPDAGAPGITDKTTPDQLRCIQRGACFTSPA